MTARKPNVTVWNTGTKDILLRGGALRPGESAVMTASEYLAVAKVPSLSTEPLLPPPVFTAPKPTLKKATTNPRRAPKKKLTKEG